MSLLRIWPVIVVSCVLTTHMIALVLATLLMATVFCSTIPEKKEKSRIVLSLRDVM